MLLALVIGMVFTMHHAQAEVYAKMRALLDQKSASTNRQRYGTR